MHYEADAIALGEEVWRLTGRCRFQAPFEIITISEKTKDCAKSRRQCTHPHNTWALQIQPKSMLFQLRSTADDSSRKIQESTIDDYSH